MLNLIAPVLALLAAFAAFVYANALAFYHAIVNLQLASELIQVPYFDPPSVELIIARAMALTKSDTLNLDNSTTRTDFEHPLRAALQDAWGGESSPTKKVHAVLRRFVLDNAVMDVGRRIRLVEAVLAEPTIRDVKLPTIVVVTSAVPFSGAEVLVKYFTSNPTKFHVPTLSDLQNIIPHAFDTPHVRVSPTELSPSTPEFETLAKYFATVEEREGVLREDVLRIGSSAYLNATFHDFHSFDKLPFPTLKSTLATHPKHNDLVLLKLLLQLHVSKLASMPEYIVLEGVEHAAYLDAFADVFGVDGVKVVKVGVVAGDGVQIVKDKMTRQLRSLRRLVLGPSSLIQDGGVLPCIDSEEVDAQIAIVDEMCGRLGEERVFSVDGTVLMNVSDEVGEGRTAVDVVGDRVVAWLDRG
ncbi:hypothetical protein HDU98_002778 [Podochytrium sp. JEL0797]|nr:hypothetical protein HDU98_002778 [Podochytrium sp. JEL0797]